MVAKKAEATATRRVRSAMPRPLRIMRYRWRLSLSALLAAVLIFALPGEWRFATRLLIGWDIGVVLYLGLCIWMISRTELKDVKADAVEEDEGRFAVPILTVLAALASLGAIFIELRTGSGGTTKAPLDLALAATTIFLSWMFIHAIFALHYAHECYYAKGKDEHGLEFPDDPEPGYWDFVYFSYCIGMTAQVSDVEVASKVIRRTVTAHGIVSFFFNVAVVALSINIAASAI